MHHVMKQALRDSVAITLKGEEDDPVSIVTNAQTSIALFHAI